MIEVLAVKEDYSEEAFIDHCLERMQSDDPVERLYWKLCRAILPPLRRESNESGLPARDQIVAAVQVVASALHNTIVAFAQPGKEEELAAMIIEDVSEAVCQATAMRAVEKGTSSGAPGAHGQVGQSGADA